ncbi:pyridoxal-dependent decarboxylase, exosortase A system-associated [Cellulomonas sp. Root137]|uniref:pyridoxal-dependent decarboxylase, exosortase A system-associated n=1 Tax=Cellulomonas sp. Root137 TaxID=1736459 RepID=UPI0006FD9518|nr:pyridoxal-dependent decarboxylase, exosortase A system-associated [Cellulomonas sp. Root137]KQY42918.1 diaminopimelate decarboxylase [Cellulomonas sp. Root137]
MTASTTVTSFGEVDGVLTVGGIGVDRLARRVGSTPFFAYDRRLVEERVALLRSVLPERLSLGYAVKANPMPAVVHLLASLVDSLDVASAYEMRVALDTGTDPSRVSFAGPGKTTAELEQAVASGVTIEVESSGEARRVVAAGAELGIRPRVAVRVNPDFAVRGSGMRMGGGPQQFGVDAEQVPDLLRELDAAGVDLLGFHVFAGSQNLSADLLMQAQSRTVELVLALSAEAPQPVRYVNLGGGFGVPYFPTDQPLDVVAVAAHLTELVETRLAPALPDAEFVIELGRYLVAEAGVYVTRVVDRKVSRGSTYLVVDGGMHHQLAASGNLGQVIRRNYPLAVGERVSAEPEETATVVGCLCTPLDLLGDRVELPRADVGDLVVVFQAGAYGLTASPTAFLGHPAPVEILV